MPSVQVPCRDITFLAHQLLQIDLGPLCPCGSIVKWHPNTLTAREQCPDWDGAPPHQIWFYTDGASRLDDGQHDRVASAAVILLPGMQTRLQFGGFRSFTVPTPATAPYAEHVAMLTATLWCLQLLDWCWCQYGLCLSRCISSSIVLLLDLLPMVLGLVTGVNPFIDSLDPFIIGLPHDMAPFLVTIMFKVTKVIHGTKLLTQRVGQPCTNVCKAPTLKPCTIRSFCPLPDLSNGSGIGKKPSMEPLDFLVVAMGI